MRLNRFDMIQSMPCRTLQCQTSTVAHPSVQAQNFPPSQLLFAIILWYPALDLRQRRSHNLSKIPLLHKLSAFIIATQRAENMTYLIFSIQRNNTSLMSPDNDLTSLDNVRTGLSLQLVRNKQK